MPLSGELWINKVVQARFQLWLSGTSARKLCKLFPLGSEAKGRVLENIKFILANIKFVLENIKFVLKT